MCMSRPHAFSIVGSVTARLFFDKSGRERRGRGSHWASDRPIQAILCSNTSVSMNCGRHGQVAALSRWPPKQTLSVLLFCFVINPPHRYIRLVRNKNGGYWFEVTLGPGVMERTKTEAVGIRAEANIRSCKLSASAGCERTTFGGLWILRIVTPWKRVYPPSLVVSGVCPQAGVHRRVPRCEASAPVCTH